MRLSPRRKLLFLSLTLGLCCALVLRFHSGDEDYCASLLAYLPRRPQAQVSGLRNGSASVLRNGSVSGLRNGSASVLRNGSASVLRNGSASGEAVHRTTLPPPPPTPGPPLKPRVHWVGYLTTTSEVNKYHIGTVACGNRVNEAVVLLKSAVALTTAGAIIFYIFTEMNQIDFFEKELKSWPDALLDRLEYRLYEATYPEKMKTWKGKFGACASQRLLFPMLLTDVDALVYLDADTLLMSPLSALWRHFSRFNATHMLALVNEHETKAVSWYHHHSKIPFFGPFGLNSGVTLMNMTRLRAVRFTETILGYEKKYGSRMPWFDQDQFNIFLHFQPERYYRLNCSANYRMDHCTSKLNGCKEVGENGVLVLHGSKRAFSRYPIFKTVHSVFREYKLKNETNNEAVLQVLKTKLQGKSSPCGDPAKLFLQHIVVKGLS